MLQVSTNVKPIRYGRIFAVLLLLLLSPLVFCYVATPTVIVYYPKEAKEKLGSVWNTQHRIYRGGRGGLYPGEVTLDFGHIFPNENFFMEFYWWGDKIRNHCVNITPKWPTTRIYLDVDGNIDTRPGSGTDTDRLKQCITDTAKP
ncbi:hypothetical protein CXP47_20520 [Pseudomonas chlororaphis]|nr:hypothetical protein CXP47_20520 [Pseudomonas chlororaphis]AZE06311.1 hypothetical protein C4K11_4158 [Pseudomonas chlororaphis subsp. aureofaciens]POA64773.1 hypothetical protein C1888_26235 [Pseudomonas sp. GW531-T4]PWY53244.1 hypothetical protein DK261_01820 [Pseudomonas sp. RW409]AZE37322.1 hypothetical protein C4K06_4298 [Pseudomonas chlororaphis subsp. aureofaciens]